MKWYRVFMKTVFAYICKCVLLAQTILKHMYTSQHHMWSPHMTMDYEDDDDNITSHFPRLCAACWMFVRISYMILNPTLSYTYIVFYIKSNLMYITCVFNIHFNKSFDGLDAEQLVYGIKTSQIGKPHIQHTWNEEMCIMGGCEKNSCNYHIHTRKKRTSSLFLILKHRKTSETLIRECDDSYLVDPASSHMLVSKIKPCMSKYKWLYTVKLRMAH